MAKDKNNEKNKKERGITLISLVVTIIILLILARNKYSNPDRKKWNINASTKCKRTDRKSSTTRRRIYGRIRRDSRCQGRRLYKK